MKLKTLLTTMLTTALLVTTAATGWGQTTLAAGDIAIIRMNNDAPDAFSFVTLVDIQAGTEIRFTDSGVKADGTFRGGEGAVKYTAPTAISAGTIISCDVSNLSALSTDFVRDDDATVGTNGMNFSSSGDQLIAFQGISTSPTYIFALNMDGDWAADATSSNNSALPMGLTNGTNAIAIIPEVDNAVYNMSTSTGTQAELLTDICTITNWTTDDINPQVAPSGSFTVSPDVTAPIATFDPVNAATNVAITTPITISFDEAIENIGGAAIDDPTSLITLKETDGSGADVAFTSTIDAAKKVITITPSADLKNNQLYYIALASVQDAAGNATGALSSTFTTIDAATPTITLTYPNGGETFYAGDDVTFTWTSTNMDAEDVKIEAYVLDKGTATWGWTDVVTSTPNTGSYAFTIPATASYGTQYSARITGLTSSATDESDAPFTIIATPSIYDIQSDNTAGASNFTGDKVRFSGIVTGLYSTTTRFFVQDSAKGWNGVYVYGSPISPALGDSVVIEGTVAEYNGLTEISPTSSTTIAASGKTLPAPIELSTIAVNDEQYESVLVKISGATCTAGSAGTYTLNDGSGDLIVNKALYSGLTLTIGKKYNVTGIVGWYNTGTVYQLYPRDVNDVYELSSDATLLDLTVNGTTVTGFDPATLTYDVELPYGTSTVPTVAYTLNNAKANAVQTDAGSLPGSTTVAVTAEDGTSQTYTLNFTVAAPSTDATVSSLTYTIDNTAETITNVPSSETLANFKTNLTPAAGATFEVYQADGTTVATDLATGYKVMVTAEDGTTTKTYTITVNTSLSTETNITSFTLASVAGTIDGSAHTVAVTVPFGTDVTALVPTITLSAGATVDPASGVAQDFTSPVTYTVTAEDGTTTQPWVVTVTVAPAPAPTFTATYPMSANIGSDQFDVVVNLNAAGKVYFQQVASGAAAPTSADLKANGTAIDVTAAATDYSATITGLTSSTAYDVYFATENATGDVLMATPVKLTVTTTAGALTIHDIQYTADASGDSPYKDQDVTITGVVTSLKYTSAGAYRGFYMQDGDGAWNGIYVYTSTTDVVAPGDNVTVNGTVAEYNNLTEISPTNTVTVNSSNNAMPSPAEVTTAVASTEPYESVLVTVKNVSCASGSAGSYIVNDGTADLTVYKALYADLTLTVGSSYDITGIMDYYSTGSMYELYPRSANDVTLLTGIGQNSSVATKAFPNPFSDNFTVNSGKVVSTVSIYNLLGQKLMERSYSATEVTVPAANLTNGIYIVNVRFQDGSAATLRMVKK